MADNKENVSITDSGNESQTSVTDQTFKSEMGVCSMPISQIESSATESVELDRVPVTPISTRSEKKTDETNAVSYTHLSY